MCWVWQGVELVERGQRGPAATDQESSRTNAVLTSQRRSLNTHPHSSQGRLDCKQSSISGQQLGEEKRETRARLKGCTSLSQIMEM